MRANQEQLKLLKLGVKGWNHWRSENPNVEVDLSGADLSKVKLVRVHLEKANLDKANLKETDFGEEISTKKLFDLLSEDEIDEALKLVSKR